MPSGPAATDGDGGPHWTQEKLLKFRVTMLLFVMRGQLSEHPLESDADEAAQKLLQQQLHSDLDEIMAEPAHPVAVLREFLGALSVSERSAARAEPCRRPLTTSSTAPCRATCLLRRRGRPPTSRSP